MVEATLCVYITAIVTNQADPLKYLYGPLRAEAPAGGGKGGHLPPPGF